MNSYAKILQLTFIAITASSFITAQSVNWYHGEKTDSTIFNINTDEVYNKILKNKQGSTIVVAVIDSGVDIEHDDLKDVIWINRDEIPGNGIDDDNNGYIDDINGWNFIGGKDGRHVGDDTLEETRYYAELRKKYNNVDPATLKGDALEEYNEFSKIGGEIEKQITSSKKQYEEFENEYNALNPSVELIEALDQGHTLNEEIIDSLGNTGERTSVIAANILNYFLTEQGGIPSAEDMRATLLDPLEEAMEYYGPKWKSQWNPDFNPRDIVGDNYNDLSETGYGNNLVEGPDAMHGTHVSGIIAASRDNEIGINGIANNVEIMVIRAVPNGDERDKDVANAIRYAVDNGASVVNMSFGKGRSPHKQLVDDAVRHAEKNDVLLVHASGNSNMDIDEGELNFPNDHFLKPKGFLFWKKKKPKNWISVGASTPFQNEDLAAEFSNYGKEDVDIFAPGLMIYSTVPDNQYEVSQGTSMAAPVITGVAALIRSYFPGLTAEQVREAILESTSQNDSLVRKPGTDELVPFSDLSVTGGIIDISSAIKKAAQMKGKKKYKKGSDLRA